MMPKTKLQDFIFTLMMAFVMVYAMVCYNIAMDMGGMTNQVFLLAFHEMPVMWPIAVILEFFIVGKLAPALAFRFMTPQDKAVIYNMRYIFNDRMYNVPCNELHRYCTL